MGRVSAPVRHVQEQTGEVRWLGSICKAGGCSRHSYFTNQISVRTLHTVPSLRDLRSRSRGFAHLRTHTQLLLSKICAAALAALHISERTQFLLSEICAAAPRLCTSPPACGGRCKRNRKEDVQASLTSSFLFRLRREGDSNS